MKEYQIIGKVLLKRRTPLTIGEIAMKADALRKTTRNTVTEISRISRWLPSGKKVVTLRDKDTFRYCVRDALEVSSASSLKYKGKRYWYKTSDEYRVLFAT